MTGVTKEIGVMGQTGERWEAGEARAIGEVGVIDLYIAKMADCCPPSVFLFNTHFYAALNRDKGGGVGGVYSRKMEIYCPTSSFLCQSTRMHIGSFCVCTTFRVVCKALGIV